MQNIRDFSDRIQKADQQIGQAMNAVQSDQGVSSKTNSCIQEFFDKSRDLVSSMSGLSDEAIRDQVFELEELADRARDAVREDSSISGQHRQMVIDAHNIVSQLKHEMQH